MSAMNQILDDARQRAQQHQLPYAGALTPAEAYALLQANPNVRLVDVRTQAELELVGRIPQALHIEWAFYPGWKPNPDFEAQLTQQVDAEAVVLFICRSGARSHNAATLAARLGFSEAYNVIEGFEGDPSPGSKQRGTVNGWKAAGLPWTNG